jgi:hypothetical protein
LASPPTSLFQPTTQKAKEGECEQSKKKKKEREREGELEVGVFEGKTRKRDT